MNNAAALMNINSFPEIVKDKIFSTWFSDVEDLDEFWNDWMNDKKEFFSDTEIPLSSEVTKADIFTI